MSNSKKLQFYAVAKGHNPGIYDNWDITLENVKGFSGALYKGFDTREEAQQYITDNTPKNTPVIQSNLHLLTNEQKYVIDCLLEGSNVFLTGGGGVGKSFLISTIYTEFPGLKRQMHIKNATPGIPRIPRIQICALTGCASLLLGNKAKTLHSWAGIGLGKGTVQELFIKVRRNTKAMRNWLCTDLLIIDEISMMNGELLDKLNSLAKRLRSNTRPFGGIQVMFVGDFYQLPPVNKSDEPTQFAFETTSWKECINKTIELTQIQRQKDVEFQKVLGEARMGKLSKESCRVLRGCMGREWQNNKIRPTLLFPRRAEVEMINSTNLKSLIGPRHNFKASIVYDGKVPIGFDTEDPVFKKTLELFDSDAGYLVDLELAVDTQVMLIANLSPEEGLVNGSRGVISHFCPTTGLPFVEFTNGIKRLIGNHLWPIEDFEFVLRSQLPLRLAYAITIHKCVSEDTLLSIPNKGLIKIKDINPIAKQNNTIYKISDINITGLCEEKQIIELYKGNIEDGIKITSTFGYEIITSNRHPLLVFNKDMFTFEWKKVPDITKDDYIIIKKGALVEGKYYSLKGITFTKPYNNIITVPAYINEDVGYFIGVMLGDGSINENTYRFDLLGIDFDILVICINIFKEQFNIIVKQHTINNRKTKTNRIFFHSKQLIELFRYIGYNFKKADKKQIPQSILESPISVQKAVIQGLYDTDGGISPSTINYTTVSDIMGQQVQQILLNMDIPVSRTVMRQDIIEKNWKKVYRINISGKSAVKFINNIGFRCKRKQDKGSLRFYEKESIQINNKSQSFEVPNGKNLINKLRDEMRNGLKRIKSDKITLCGNKLLSNIINNKQKLRCDSINVLINEIDNISQYSTGKLLSFIYSNGILIDTIRSIDIVKDIQMYDIGVLPINSSKLLPDGHDFIGNGFVNHNCQGATLDSALVDIGTSNFEFGQAYVALSRARSLDALYVYDFDPTAFKVHKRVKEFYDNLIRDKIPEEHLTDTIKIDLNNQSNSDDIKPITAITSEAISAVTAVKLQEESIMPNNWLYEGIPDGWKTHLSQVENKLAELCKALEGKDFLPAKENIWRALELTPLDTIKIVILGQDPYPTKGNAHGLAFSVQSDVKPLPASLKNIYKELKADIGIDTPSHGNLEKWSASGIMLLNTVLTVEEGAPQSHSKIGWETVTDEIIKTIASKCTNVVFILWGKSAQVKRKLINNYVNQNKHYIYESAHPSPLSASKGFFGSKPFSKVNEWRKSVSLEPINWSI